MLAAEFERYSKQLVSFEEKVTAAQSALEEVCSSLFSVAESVTPLASSVGLGCEASELLNAATTMSTSVSTALSRTIGSTLLQPLHYITAAHAELLARMTARAEAVAAYEAAVADLARLQRKQAARSKRGVAGKASSGIMSALNAAMSMRSPTGPSPTGSAGSGTSAGGGGSGNGGDSESDGEASGTMAQPNNAKFLTAQAKVVSRLSSSQALVDVLTEGLTDELLHLRSRRRDVVTKLLSALGSVSHLGALAAADVFAGCDFSESLGEPRAGADAGQVGGAAPGTSISSSAGVTAHVQRLERLCTSASTGAAWYDEGQASRSHARESAARRKADARSKLIVQGVTREVPLESYLIVEVGAADGTSAARMASPPSTLASSSSASSGVAAGVQDAGGKLRLAVSRPPGISGRQLVLESPAWLPRILQGLSVTEAGRFLQASRLLAQQGSTSSAFWLSLLRSGGLDPAYEGTELAFRRLRMWQWLLGPTCKLTDSAATATSTMSHAHVDSDAFTALLRLAAAEAAVGGKGEGTPSTEYHADNEHGEGSVVRWATLIEQDVARSYQAGVPFGTSGVVKRQRRALTHSKRAAVARALAGTDDAAAATLQTDAHQRYANHHSAQRLLPSVQTAGRTAQLRPRRRSLPTTLRVDTAAAEESVAHMSLTSFLHASRADIESSDAAFPHDSHAAADAVDYRPRSWSCFADLGAVGARGSAVTQTTASEAAAKAGHTGRHDATDVADAAAAIADSGALALESRRSLLSSVLFALAAAEPEMRYTQGLNCLARFVLELVAAAHEHERGEGAGVPDPAAAQAIAVETYNVLSGILHKPPAAVPHHTGTSGGLANQWRLLHIFLPDMSCLQLRLYQLDRLLLRRLPELHGHLQQEGITTNAYASPWLLTLFSSFSVLDARTTAAVWDSYLLTGWSAVLSMCLSVLVLLAPLLQGAPMEDCLAALQAPRLYLQDATQSWAATGWERAEVDASAAAREQAAMAVLRRRAREHPLCVVTEEEVSELEQDYQFLNSAGGAGQSR